MIEPEEIRRKALRLYPQFVRTWLAGEDFFPYTLRSNRNPDKENLAVASGQVERLRAGSKQGRGFGYSVDWIEKKSPIHGTNWFPARIYFETQDDLLRLIGKQQEFAIYSAAVASIRARHPVLEKWIRTHRADLARVAGEVEGLLEVVDCLLANPRPEVFARELPLSVDTKFIERHKKILQAWLDLVLPPHEVRADEAHFERRFGLRYDEPYFHVRFLDAALQAESGVPWSECAVPMSQLAATPPGGEIVVIVENKVNLLTLPPIARGVALGGLGNGVVDLRYLGWLRERRVWYWGDIDVEGFEILARLRKEFPHVQSLMMDDRAIALWATPLGSQGTGREVPAPGNLTDAEQSAFRACVSQNLRIEQERIPQEDAERGLREQLS